MKATELIAQLEAMVAEHGDLFVVNNYAGGPRPIRGPWVSDDLWHLEWVDEVETKAIVVD